MHTWQCRSLIAPPPSETTTIDAEDLAEVRLTLAKANNATSPTSMSRDVADSQDCERRTLNRIDNRPTHFMKQAEVWFSFHISICVI